MVLVVKKGDPVVCVSPMDEIPNGSVGWVKGFVRAAVPCVRPCGRMGLDYVRCGVSNGAFVEDWKYVGSQGCEDACGVPDGSWPSVEFLVKGERVKKTVFPKLMVVEDADGEVVCSRFQVPLLLAYSFTVHRVQVPAILCTTCHEFLLRVSSIRLQVGGVIGSGCGCWGL